MALEWDIQLRLTGGLSHLRTADDPVRGPPTRDQRGRQEPHQDAALKACFEANGFENVSTYIQSGNVVFEAADRPSLQLTRRIEAMLAEAFDYVPTVVVRNRKQMQAIVDRAPKGFGAEPKKYRYDVFFLKEPLTATAAMKHLPTNPAVDRADAGTSVLYVSRLTAKATQSRLNKIISSPIYPSVTIRNWNTTTKLLELMG